MSSEEERIRQLKEWLTNYPGAQQHFPALLILRSGPLKAFVDDHLVGEMRSEEWIANMNEHFLFEDLMNGTDTERSSLERDQEELNKLEMDLSQLELEEESMEKEIGGALMDTKPSSDLEESVLLMQREVHLLSITSLLHQTEALRSGIGELFSSDGVIPNTCNTTLNNKNKTSMASVSERLEGAKEFLSKSLFLSARGVESREKAVDLRSSATASLDELSLRSNLNITGTGVGEDGYVSGVGYWFAHDIEGDMTQFRSDMDQMKADEKVSVIQKMVDDWAALHVSLDAQNRDLETAMILAKHQLETLTRSSPQELETILRLLVDEKKTELTHLHFYTMPDSSDSISNEQPEMEPQEMLTMNMDMGSSLSPFPKAVLSFPTDYDFNFALTCSLFKTWPNLKFVYGKAVDDEQGSLESWAENADRLREELKGTMPIYSVTTGN